MSKVVLDAVYLSIVLEDINRSGSIGRRLANDDVESHIARHLIVGCQSLGYHSG